MGIALARLRRLRVTLEQAAAAVLEAWDADDEGQLAEAIYQLGLAVAEIDLRTRAATTYDC